MITVSEIELLKLWTAYRRIKDPVKRRQLLELIERYASESTASTPQDDREPNRGFN